LSRKKVSVVIIVLLAMLLLVVSVPPAKAQFVLASSDYPDEYGQGVYAWWVYENSTGAWETVGGYRTYNDSDLYEWNASVGIKIVYYTWFNSTLTGASDSDDGKNYLQHSVTVVNNTGGTVFSQQHFTYHSVSTANDPMWFYSYYVVLNFLPLGGQIYTVSVTYEVFW